MVSGKLVATHPVDPFADHDLGMLAVADIAAESTRAAVPAHLIADPPNRVYPDDDGRGTSGVALARLPRLASGESCSTRHPSTTSSPSCGYGAAFIAAL